MNPFFYYLTPGSSQGYYEIKIKLPKIKNESNEENTSDNKKYYIYTYKISSLYDII